MNFSRGCSGGAAEGQPRERGGAAHVRRYIVAARVPQNRCSSAPPPPSPKPPPVVTIPLNASANQNANIDGAPSQVAVRIIQLTPTDKFERAKVLGLIDDAQRTLGADAAGMIEVILSPSEQRGIRIDPKPGVTSIGVAVLYRDIDDALWRVDAPVATNGLTSLIAGIGKLTVSASGIAIHASGDFPNLRLELWAIRG